MSFRFTRSMGLLARILRDDDPNHDDDDSDDGTDSRAEPFATHQFRDDEWNNSADVDRISNRPAVSDSLQSVIRVRSGPPITVKKGRGSDLVGSKGLEAPSIRARSGNKRSIRRRRPSHTVQSTICGEVALSTQ